MKVCEQVIRYVRRDSRKLVAGTAEDTHQIEKAVRVREATKKYTERVKSENAQPIFCYYNVRNG